MPDYIINFFLIPFVIFFTNILAKKIKRLNNFSGLPHQILTKKEAIPLSGGLTLIFLIIVKFNFIEINLFFFLMPIFLIGFLADIRILKSPIIRFGLQIIILSIFIIFLDLTILDIRVPWFDNFLANKYFNYFFVLFCFLVLINGSNFIDGNNALVIGYYSLIFFVILNLNNFEPNIQYQNFLNFLLISLLTLLIFNIFNKLYLGDGGVYLLSTITGYFLVKLYADNPNISPFFIVNLLWYPSFEILFSLIRKIKAKYSPMDPDTQHLHQLIFRKFLACFNNRVVISNSLTGITINTYHLIIFYISFLNYSESLFQVYMITLNIMIYLFLYFLLKNNLFIKK